MYPGGDAFARPMSAYGGGGMMSPGLAYGVSLIGAALCGSLSVHMADISFETFAANPEHVLAGTSDEPLCAATSHDGCTDGLPEFHVYGYVRCG